MRRASDCVAAFRVWGLGDGRLKCILFFSCVVLLTASRDFSFGRRALEPGVAFRVWGLAGGRLKYMFDWVLGGGGERHVGFSCVMFLAASQAGRLRRRTSERVVAVKVWGLGGGCLKYILRFSCVVLLTA